jgi:hypothetical protein
MSTSEFFTIALSEIFELPRSFVRERLGRPDLKHAMAGSIPDAEAERWLAEVRDGRVHMRRWANHIRLNVRTEEFMKVYFSMVDGRARRGRATLDPSSTSG